MKPLTKTAERGERKNKWKCKTAEIMLMLMVAGISGLLIVNAWLTFALLVKDGVAAADAAIVVVALFLNAAFWNTEESEAFRLQLWHRKLGSCCTFTVEESRLYYFLPEKLKVGYGDCTSAEPYSQPDFLILSLLLLFFHLSAVPRCKRKNNTTAKREMTIYLIIYFFFLVFLTNHMIIHIRVLSQQVAIFVFVLLVKPGRASCEFLLFLCKKSEVTAKELPHWDKCSFWRKYFSSLIKKTIKSLISALVTLKNPLF